MVHKKRSRKKSKNKRATKGTFILLGQGHSGRIFQLTLPVYAQSFRVDIIYNLGCPMSGCVYVTEYFTKMFTNNFQMSSSHSDLLHSMKIGNF